MLLLLLLLRLAHIKGGFLSLMYDSDNDDSQYRQKECECIYKCVCACTLGMGKCTQPYIYTNEHLRSIHISPSPQRPPRHASMPPPLRDLVCFPDEFLLVVGVPLAVAAPIEPGVAAVAPSSASISRSSAQRDEKDGLSPLLCAQLRSTRPLSSART